MIIIIITGYNNNEGLPLKRRKEVASKQTEP